MNTMHSVLSGTSSPAVAGARAIAWRDFAVVVSITVITAVLCARLDVNETLLSWTRPHERWQLDELPAVLLTLAVCLIWFSVRRYREVRREIGLRRRAEAGLSSALAENRRLAQQYLEIQEAERRALARDLHDELGQYLNVVKVDAVALRERFATADPIAHRASADMIRNIDRIQAVVMGLIRQLRPVGLDELGLVAALEHCVEEWRRRLPQLAIELEIGEDLEQLDEVRSLALYRLVQEALTNVARHSQATGVAIRIARAGARAASPDRIIAEVADNGVGTDLTRAGRGLGLVGMRERMEAVGGSLVVASSPGGGFTLRAELPAGTAP